jgi:hypothetical protein
LFTSQSEEDAFYFLGHEHHELSKNVDKLPEILWGFSGALFQGNQNVTSQMRTCIRLSHLEHNSDDEAAN